MRLWLADSAGCFRLPESVGDQSPYSISRTSPHKIAGIKKPSGVAGQETHGEHKECRIRANGERIVPELTKKLAKLGKVCALSQAIRMAFLEQSIAVARAHKIKIIARCNHVNCTSSNPDNGRFGIRLGALPH